ncbi:XdhC family protein [Herbaspirillum sp.]|uniref:XdhC family protein n=1 Tax=Herbaspirillum sp. TaxID=1890675 RepID=UPI0031D4CB65
MESLDLEVLRTARHWRQQGHAAQLFTVARTWGSAPRGPGAMVAIRDDGRVVGSVSGGCVEDDLIERVRQDGAALARPELLEYGLTREQAERFGLPCGGSLVLVREALPHAGWLDTVLEATAAQGRIRRQLDLRDGTVCCRALPDAGGALPRPQLEQDRFTVCYGPRWRLLMIGAGQLSQVLARMALMLDYDVLVCDPREEYAAGWEVAGSRLLSGMPDDVVLAMQADAHTAIVALTHDPRLDDMALLEALASPAFYVGALGSHANSRRRRERLALFDLDAAQIARLHAPIGLPIDSHTPAEIAVSILAQMTAVRNAADRTSSAAAPDAGDHRSLPGQDATR